MRLQKYLSAAGVCSRRKGEEFIAAGRVSVNGRTVTEPGTKVDAGNDVVDIAGRVYPVGRLDKDSTGLLILTNDGRLHQRLAHPSYDHEKE